MITVRQRYRPFTHTPGYSHLLPGTPYVFKVFPTRIEIRHIDGTDLGHLSHEPVSQIERFTVQTDLHSGKITIFSSCYYLQILLGKGFLIRIDKGNWKYVGDALTVVDGGYAYGDQMPPTKPLPLLSLGCNKAQEWDQIRCRKDMSEILPYWYLYGSYYSGIETSAEGTLLQQCAQAGPLEVVSAFNQLYLSGIAPAFSPRAFDDDYHGFHLPPAKEPLAIVAQGAQIIERLFIRFDHERLEILPVLPPEFHCGRLVDLHIQGLGKVSLEWSKKALRRMMITPDATKKITLCLPKEVKSYRLQKRIWKKIDDPLELTAGGTLYFDRFQK